MGNTAAAAACGSVPADSPGKSALQKDSISIQTIEALEKENITLRKRIVELEIRNAELGKRVGYLEGGGDVVCRVAKEFLYSRIENEGEIIQKGLSEMLQQAVNNKEVAKVKAALSYGAYPLRSRKEDRGLIAVAITDPDPSPEIIRELLEATRVETIDHAELAWALSDLFRESLSLDYQLFDEDGFGSETKRLQDSCVEIFNACVEWGFNVNIRGNLESISMYTGGGDDDDTILAPLFRDKIVYHWSRRIFGSPTPPAEERFEHFLGIVKLLIDACMDLGWEPRNQETFLHTIISTFDHSNLRINWLLELTRLAVECGGSITDFNRCGRTVGQVFLEQVLDGYFGNQPWRDPDFSDASYLCDCDKLEALKFIAKHGHEDKYQEDVPPEMLEIAKLLGVEKDMPQKLTVFFEPGEMTLEAKIMDLRVKIEEDSWPDATTEFIDDIDSDDTKTITSDSMGSGFHESGYENDYI